MNMSPPVDLPEGGTAAESRVRQRSAGSEGSGPGNEVEDKRRAGKKQEGPLIKWQTLLVNSRK